MQGDSSYRSHGKARRWSFAQLFIFGLGVGEANELWSLSHCYVVVHVNHQPEKLGNPRV